MCLTLQMISSCTHFVSWCFSQNDFINEEEMYNQMTSSKEGANIYYLLLAVK